MAKYGVCTRHHSSKHATAAQPYSIPAFRWIQRYVGLGEIFVLGKHPVLILYWHSALLQFYDAH